MKSVEQVEALEEGDIVWDKNTKDQHGNPLKWKVAGPIRKARRNPECFIRQIELIWEPKDQDEKLEGEDAEEVKGYVVMDEETMFNYTTNEGMARLSFILWDMEDGITPELVEKFRVASNMLLADPMAAERFKKLGLQ